MPRAEFVGEILRQQTEPGAQATGDRDQGGLLPSPRRRAPSAMAPPSAMAGESSRTSLTAPRNTLSNAARHVSSGIASALPAGGPPTLTSRPSSQPQRSITAAFRRRGRSGSALSP